MNSRRSIRVRSAVLTFVALALASCGKKDEPLKGGFAVRVVTAVVQKEDLLEKIPVVGTLVANEAVELLTEIGGRIEGIEFIEGQAVTRGQVLFRVDEKKLRAQLRKVEAKFKLSKATHERRKATFDKRVISKQEYEKALAQYEVDKADLEFARLKLEDATIRAPFDGVVGARFVSPRQVVKKGQKLSSLVDSDPIKVEFRIPERYAGNLRRNQQVRLSVATFPGETFFGKTFFVSPAVDPETRTVLVKARIPNKKRRLQPGMFANLDLIIGVRKDAATIPETALMRSGRSESVFVVDAENKAALRPVKIGLRLEGKVQILEGVQAGERVVTEGLQKVRPGASLSFNDAKPAEKRS